jgi:hypothetical protein
MSDYQRWYECTACGAFTVRFDDDEHACCGDVREIDREALIAQMFDDALASSAERTAALLEIRKPE